LTILICMVKETLGLKMFTVGLSAPKRAKYASLRDFVEFCATSTYQQMPILFALTLRLVDSESSVWRIVQYFVLREATRRVRHGL